MQNFHFPFYFKFFRILFILFYLKKKTLLQEERGKRRRRLKVFAVGVSASMEASQATTTTEDPNPSPNLRRRDLNLNSISSSSPVWPTIDGPLGLSEEEALSYARRFYNFGFLLLPLLWAVNCFYFWPVLRHSRSFPRIHYCMFLSLFSSFSLSFSRCFSRQTNTV